MARARTRDGKKHLGISQFVTIIVIILLALLVLGLSGPRHAVAAGRQEEKALASEAPGVARAPSQMPERLLRGGNTPNSRVALGRTRSGFPTIEVALQTPLFLPGGSYPTGDSNNAVLVKDVNKDGHPDLLVADWCANDSNDCEYGAALVRLGNADGGFQPVQSYPSGGLFTSSIAVGDVNRDGKFDVLVANWCTETRPLVSCSNASGSVGVLLGKGDGTFLGVQKYYSGGDYTYSIALKDVNGDAKLDAVVTNFGSDSGCAKGSVSVLLGNGDGTFQQPVSYDSGAGLANFVAVADVDGDGKPDLVVASDGYYYCATAAGDHGVVGILHGNGDGTFGPVVTYDSGGIVAQSVAVSDFNGDGHPDVAVANFWSDTVGMLIGNGDGTFAPPVIYDASGHYPISLATADVDRDGKADLLIGNECLGNCTHSGVSVLLGRGDGTLQQAVSVDIPQQSLRSIAVADMNGDRRSDVAVAHYYGVDVLLNNTGPHSPTTTELVSSLNPAVPHQPVTYKATVGNQSNEAVTGTIMFQDGDRILATFPVINNQAAYTATYNWPGVRAHEILTVYSGDLHNSASTSPTITQYIGVAPFGSKTVISASMSPSLIGQPVTFTATVTPAESKYGAIPDGRLVTFYDGFTTLGSVPLVSGRAMFTTSSLAAKTHTIIATSTGDALFKGSTAQMAQAVQKYPTITTRWSSLNPSNHGQAVTFTARVTSSGPDEPTGKVIFKDGTIGIGSAILSGGVAKLTKSTLAVGTHPITALYQGDAASATSKSSVLNQVVK